MLNNVDVILLKKPSHRFDEEILQSLLKRQSSGFY